MFRKKHTHTSSHAGRTPRIVVGCGHDDVIRMDGSCRAVVGWYTGQMDLPKMQQDCCWHYLLDPILIILQVSAWTFSGEEGVPLPRNHHPVARGNAPSFSFSGSSFVCWGFSLPIHKLPIILTSLFHIRMRHEGTRFSFSGSSAVWWGFSLPIHKLHSLTSLFFHVRMHEGPPGSKMPVG